MSDRELEIGSLPVVTILDQYTLKIRIKKEGTTGPSGGDGYKEEQFTFDSCFGQNTQQEEIFEDTKRLMQSAIDGFNVCLFAYGQTGSGKTYTIQGSPEMPGIVPRALEELFTLRKNKELSYTVKFECYMVELYLDQLHDLLAPAPDHDNPGARKPKLELREDPETNMMNIKNVQTLPVNSL